ncbi:hypothetical protein NE237_000407 [Protea cynaroides]|uniref:Uncharacterized protein n=1 Tax=Protea cynaroides TaxID=273540 RepID=A0A9Q0KRZ0_9MAGN|nr:hypothetical protein NE237_000407 [Protea cynaroides]
MADTVVSTLVINLSQLLVNEVNFLLGVEVQVQALSKELEYMNTFLKNSEGKRDPHTNVMVLVDQIREIAREAEDIVDTYVVNVAKQRRQNKAVKFFRSFDRATMLYNIGEQITQLKTSIREIYENSSKYHIQQKDIDEADQESQRLDLLQKRRMQVEEDDVVGFVQEAKTLVNQLVEGTEELDVISISGMGGLGKTTLARKVYKDVFVRDRFRCRAWVSVSQNFKLKELLLAIIKEVAPMTDEISEMTEEELKQELKKQLSHHRYLVVVDDIWRRQDWDELKQVFPNDKNGSRVFVTTRIKEVAFQASVNPPLELRFLYDYESWELFTKKVFRRGVCPADLEPLGKEIVAKCGGLPLAIVVLGGLLACREKTYHTWKNMVGSVDWHIAQDPQCLDILGLSYADLPPYLQPCFLYLGLFPEDYKIPVRQLIQLWISEGLIQHEDNKSKTLRKEDVSENYLQQLIDRSLIQVEERRSDGGVKTCRVHDLIRDLCLKLSEKEKFLESHSSVPSSQTKPRRLSIHCSRREYILNVDPSNSCHVRTLLCFNQDSHKLSEQHWELLFKSFKLLRVLDLGDGEVHRLPKAIDKLILLKYLRVITADIAGVPLSICALHNLQTLDLRRSRINVLPEGIWNMQQLRHLYLDGPSRLPKNASEKGLSNLQTLCYVSKDPTGRVHIAEKAPNLRKLGLYGYQCYSSDEQKSTFNLPYLESLKFANECNFEEPVQLPPTITKISIKGAYLQPETIEIFQNLPKLRILKLDGASFDDEMVFGEDGFPELQLLKIENSSIVKWKLGQGAVPKLKRVVINKCPGLKMLPKELWDMTTLQELELLWLPKSFTKTIGEIKKRDELNVVIYPAVP